MRAPSTSTDAWRAKRYAAATDGYEEHMRHEPVLRRRRGRLAAV